MRFKQQPIGQFGRKDARHGLTGYTSHGCRCAICCAAKSRYQKQRYVPKGPALRVESEQGQQETPGPWWAAAPQVGMTKLAIKDHQTRMSAAKTTGRVSVPDGWR